MDIVAPVVGASIGFALGGPAGAQAGWAIGSAVGGLLGPRPKGPGPGDLSAPRLQLGSQIPRPYGRVRLAVSPISISAFRATAQESGGKGPSSQVTGYTYDLDVYGIVADTPVIPVIAVVREWHNKELIFTALADSTDESVVASTATDRYASVVDLFGGVLQDPAPLYEDRVGAANAPSNILMHTREYAGLQCGSTKTLPQIEVEVITKGTLGGVDLFEPQIIPGGTFSDETPPGDYVSHVTFPRPSTAWYWEIRGYTYTSSDGTTNNNIARWVGNNGLGLYFIAVYNAGTQGNLRVSFNNAEGWTSTLDGSAGNGTIRIEYDGISTARILHNGVEVWTSTVLALQTASVNASDAMEISKTWPYYTIPHVFSISEIELYPDPSGSADVWTPLPEALSDVITAELSLYPDFDPASIDVTDITGIDVTGFTAVGDPARNVAELCDMFYVGVVPGYPVKFVQLGAAVVGTIPFADTGAGAGQPGESFHGLDQGDNDEISGVKAIRYPSIGRDHNPDFRRGDRLTTDGPDVQATETRVVFTDAEAKGRAITATLMARDAKDTAEFPISDKYAAAEPIDCYTVTDREGNSYRLRIDALTYADGVRSCRWTKDEPASLVQSGLTDISNAPGIELAPTADVTLYVLDIPILQDADNNFGLYACCTATGTWNGARVFKSPDDATYTEVAALANRATVGSASGVLANYTGWTWDNTSTLTVTLVDGSGGVLTSATKTAIEASETLNAAAVGIHGRWELIRFATATLVTGTTYLLSGFLRGQKGTEWANGLHQAGDQFVLLQQAGMARIVGSASDFEVVRYYKGVPNGRSAASITGSAFTTAEEGLKPYAPVDLTNDAGTLRWNRRSRLSTVVGLDPPLGEDYESYAVELDGVETSTVSTNEWTPVAPVSGETLLVAQRSAQVGAGHEASKDIA